MFLNTLLQGKKLINRRLFDGRPTDNDWHNYRNVG